MMNIKTYFIVGLFLSMTLGWSHSANAQLPRDVRDVFEGMMEDLDADLQKKFKAAIKKNTATVDLTPSQFFRFRDNPANPFEGLHNIKVDNDGGNIALKFELPSMRDRTVHMLERQSKIVLSQITQPVSSVSASTVAFFSGERQVTLGIVVREDGHVLTKASEVENRENLTCKLPGGRTVEAMLLRTDSKNDLALVKIKAESLPAIRWSDTKTLPGAFVLTPRPNGTVIALGTYSVVPRSTAQGEQGFLGVEPETTTQGVRVSGIARGAASYDAGLRDNDVITKLGDVVITDVPSLVKSIRDRRPGDQVAIEYLRLGKPLKTKATLSGRKESGEQAARFKMMNRLGALPSRRDDNFPTVFQHDSPLFPEDCGGPITDLDGNVIGINIARYGRAATFAIPSEHVQTILSDLFRSNVASR